MVIDTRKELTWNGGKELQKRVIEMLYILFGKATFFIAYKLYVS